MKNKSELPRIDVAVQTGTLYFSETFNQTMSPETAPAEKFQARLFWNSYPDSPPSLKFRDIETGRLDLPSAWPVVRGFRPASLDACVNYCREGFGLHPEWVNDANLKWLATGNPVLRVIRTLQSEMDRHFNGRFK